jgi:hypothetical protein
LSLKASPSFKCPTALVMLSENLKAVLAASRIPLWGQQTALVDADDMGKAIAVFIYFRYFKKKKKKEAQSCASLS